MERQILEAALAVVRPGTPPDTRSHASSSLEAWTRTDDAATWESYATLLTLFFGLAPASDSGHGVVGGGVERVAAETSPPGSSLAVVQGDAAGARLLLLTMLHAKIRREYGRGFLAAGHRPDLEIRIRDGIVTSMTAGNDNGSAVVPDAAAMAQLCSCAAAIAVRTTGGMRDLVGSAHGALVALASPVGNGSLHGSANGTPPPPAGGLSPQAALRVLSCLPEEADASDRTAKELDDEILGCVRVVLDAVGSVLKPLAGSAVGGSASILGEADVVVALKVLGNWIQRCRITLSQLNSGGDASLLAVLVTVLSHPNPASEDVLSSASLALSNAVVDPPDGGSEARRNAVAILLGSVQSNGFLVAPFAYSMANEWDDGAHGIATLAGVLACEEMETVALCHLPGCSQLIELLLRITAHPARSVAVQALEAWLTLQDIPTTERHPDAAAPLFGKIVDILIPRVSYTDSFVSWEEEDELDPQDFAEMRRMVSDVLVSAYFLLRVDYVDRIVEQIRKDPTRWTVTESALFGLTAPSREICARVKARAGGRSVAADKEATASRLVTLASELCSGGADAAAGRHGLVLSAVAAFVGSFAPVWNVCCAPEALLDMLTYLMDATKHPPAAAAATKSARQIFVGCSGKLSPVAEGAAAQGGDVTANPLAICLAGAMEASLAAGGEEGMKFVAEGSTRLCMQIKDATVMRQILCITVAPVLRGLQQALDSVRSAGDGTGAAAAQLELSCQGVATCLRVLREVVRFCDEPSSPDETYALTDVLNVLWPLLNDIVSTPACRKHESVLSELLNVHGQLLSNAKALVAPHFSALVTFVVQSFEETHLPCALDYVSAAVEAFGGDGADTENSFSQLLAHLSQCACTFVTQEKRPNECPEVIKALFEMTQRYLLFSPQALVACSEFSTLFSLAVACLDECKGERESTRATLTFLAQTVGWKSLRLSPSANAALEAASGTISTSVLQHGEVVTKSCVIALSGGAPQMLWPAYSECIFAFITHVLGSSLSPVNGEDLALQWMTSALSDDSALSNSNGVVMSAETKNAVTHFLFGLAKEGPKSKPRAKMLLGDFGKICKGEATADVLVAYSLD